MLKTISRILATRPWVRHVDDERGDGSGIIVTLATGFDFADDPGCGVKGFDTVREVLVGTSKSSVLSKQPSRSTLATRFLVFGQVGRKTSLPFPALTGLKLAS